MKSKTTPTLSPLPGMAAVRGFRSCSVKAGIKKSGNPDVMLVVADAPVTAAGCFTKNKAAAAPVLISKANLRKPLHRAVVINAGNANCCTGSEGHATAAAMCNEVAALIGCAPTQILVASTGVIGVPLPRDKVTAGIASAFASLDTPAFPAALGILTTDTKAKEIASVHPDGWRIGGICKGSGMIHPNMATMLGVVLTDAKVGKADLAAATKLAVQRSFNRISVDNDESTNDCVFVLASGAAGGKALKGKALAAFTETLTLTCQNLAQQIVRDGEGASTFISVTVKGAVTEKAANQVAGAICDSMLVKTAFAGRDPNWGRMVAAAGYSGVPFELDALSVTLNGVQIFSKGGGHSDAGRPFVSVETGKAVKRSELAASMKEGDQVVVVDLGRGRASATRWTSDLTHGYITINAEYTT